MNYSGFFISANLF